MHGVLEPAQRLIPRDRGRFERGESVIHRDTVDDEGDERRIDPRPSGVQPRPSRFEGVARALGVHRCTSLSPRGPSGFHSGTTIAKERQVDSFSQARRREPQGGIRVSWRLGQEIEPRRTARGGRGRKRHGIEKDERQSEVEGKVHQVRSRREPAAHEGRRLLGDAGVHAGAGAHALRQSRRGRDRGGERAASAGSRAADTSSQRSGPTATT